MAFPSTAITRTELGMNYEEFDLEMSRRGFIGARVYRPLMVGVQASDVPLVPIEQLLQNKAGLTKRAPGATYRKGDFEWNKWSYATEEYGWEEPLDDRTLNMYRDLIYAEVIHANRAIDFVLRDFEVQAAAKLYDTAVWTGAALTTTLAVDWETPATATPQADVFAAIEKVKSNCGLRANGMTCTDGTIRDLVQVASIIDLIKYWGGDDPKTITPSTLAQIFTLDFILVAGMAIKNTAAAGSLTIADIWNEDYSMVGKFAVSDDPAEPCIGRAPMWTTESAGPGSDGQIAVTVEEYRHEETRGSRYRARTDYTLNNLTVECGHLLTNLT